MRSTFKVLFYVNGSKEKNGIVPIMGRVTINGSVAQFSCKCSIPKELWDAKGNRAKGKSKEARGINLSLDNIKAQIIKHYQRLSDREAYVTADMVRNAYQGIGTEYETILGAFDKENAKFLKRVGKDRCMGSYRVMVRSRNYVASRAHYNGLIPRNPFAQFRITPNVKEREYLTEGEIRQLIEHEFSDATNVWMSEMELVELFGVIVPTLRAAIKTIYKNCGLCPTSTQRYSSVTPKS